VSEGRGYPSSDARHRWRPANKAIKARIGASCGVRREGRTSRGTDVGEPAGPGTGSGGQLMGTSAPGRLARRSRRLSPRAAMLTGGALMVAGQVIFTVMALTAVGLPSLDTSGLLVALLGLIGVVLLWLGPVVVAMAAGQPGWIGAIALPGGYAVWILGTVGASSLADGAVLTAVESALPVLSFAGALAVVSGGRVCHRLAGVTVIAGLAGAFGFRSQGASAAASVGLLAAFGFLAWVAPRSRPSTSASPASTASAPSP
jgi:hypothetical protein